MIIAVISGLTGTLRNDWYAKMWWMALGRALCGQSDVSILENGQSPCILPSAAYVMPAKLKNAIIRNDSKTSGTVIFLNTKDIQFILHHFDNLAIVKCDSAVGEGRIFCYYIECTMSPFSAGIIVLAVIGIILLARPRRFYFVRHGETILNEQHIRQGEDGGLSENGKRQAEAIGAYLKRFPIERIIASTYQRAKETSEIINKHLKVQIINSPLLAERKNPKEIIGKSTSDTEVVQIVDQMDNAYHEDEYRFSDEENFTDLKTRARKCLALLARQGAQETAVITHHHFLKMLVAYMLYRERLHSSDFTKLTFFNVSDNAGITVCEFSPLNIFSPTRGWRVISYNDQPA